MIDWNKAPGATIYAANMFWCQDVDSPEFFDVLTVHLGIFKTVISRAQLDVLKEFDDFEINPDVNLLPCQTFKDEIHGEIKLNPCNVSEAHVKLNKIVSKAKEAKPYEFDDPVSAQYLNRCKAVQAERGKQYDSKGTGERSFKAAAQAFNALTGEKLKGSDVCLLLTCLKVVRQNSDNSRIHDDSLLDGISYLSLWAEELTKEIDNV